MTQPRPSLEYAINSLRDGRGLIFFSVGTVDRIIERLTAASKEQEKGSK